MQTTASNLIRWSDLAAVAAGTLFIGIQFIHPLDVLSSVTTPQWAIAHYLGALMELILVGTAIGMHPVLRPYGERIALGHLFFRVKGFNSSALASASATTETRTILTQSNRTHGGGVKPSPTHITLHNVSRNSYTE